jgi:hypothetical protein
MPIIIKDEAGNNYSPFEEEGGNGAISNDGIGIEEGGSGGGTRTTIISGCTNPNATNYNQNATVDDGSCVIGYGSAPVEVDNQVYITFVSNPTNGGIFIDGLDSGFKSTSTLNFNSKEFLTPKIFTVQQSGQTSATKYKVESYKLTPVISPFYDEFGNLIVTNYWSSYDGSGFNNNQYTDYNGGIGYSYDNNGYSYYNGNSGYAYNNNGSYMYVDYYDTSGITSYPIKVSELIDGIWTEISAVSVTPLQTNVRLEFNLTEIIEPDEPIETIYQISVEGDVSSNDIVRYTTSDGISGFVEDDTPNVFNIASPLNSDGLPWIQFENSDNSTYNVSYQVLNPDSVTPIDITDDFKKEILAGVTRILVTADKLIVVVPPTAPAIIVESVSYEYNIVSGDVLHIPYTTTNADSVNYSLGTIQRNTFANGVINLVAEDFTNGIGQYTVYLQPISDTNGSGPLKQVVINVVSKVYLPGPDITHINYPYNIKGADFKGYNEEFQISWQSINTNYIEIYVSKASSEFLLAQGAPQGAAKFIVADVLTQAKTAFNDSTDVLTFDLILVPYNQEGDELARGKEEKITIIFDKGDLKLKRAQVLTDIKLSFQEQLNTTILDSETSRYLTHYSHFGDGDNKLISTWGIDKDTFSTFITDDETNIRTTVNEVRSLVLKLYEPLENKFQPNQQLWVSKIQSIPVLSQVVITDEDSDSCTLLQPNFNLDLGDDIGYQILDDLVASGSVSSTELIEEYLGTNEFSLAKLDLNYLSGSEYNWTEFVKYSSAEERAENFFYKTQTIEFHTNTLIALESSSLATTGSISVQNEITRTEEKIFNIKKGFDAFENLLYTQYDEDGLTYPGAGESELSGSSESVTEDWYNNIIGSANDYDKYNKNALVNNIPEHIVTDEQGQDFILFFNMIGQHFDVIWSYIKGVAKSKHLTHNYDEGMTNDLIYHMLESLGWDADMGVKSQFLWEYAFGKNKDGTSASTMTGKERQQEIWRRLLNNLPYLYKHKGTKRALTAAMACYGIPSSMLTIMEFGGPVDPNASGVHSFTFDDRTAAITFDDVASVLIPWKSYTGTSENPNSVEIRINTDLRRNHTLISASGWDLQLKTETISGSLGYLEMTMGAYSASTEWFPVFNDEYTQIVVNRTVSGSLDVFDIYGKEGFNERIRNAGIGQLIVSSSSSTWDSGTELTIGLGFTGSMDEFRLWSTPLDESRIDNHTLLPDAIDGNHVSASTEDLIFRLDFEYPKDRNADTAIKNVSINQLYGEPSASAQNFSSVTDYPYQYIPYERTVTAQVPSTGVGFSNKVRFESQTLENYLNFGTTSNVTSFENADDSSKLGLFFSPMREINMDILRSLGSFNIDNYIGNPSDVYNDGYSELDTLRNYYFDRYSLNIYEYIQLVRYIDQTLFTTLESLVPGRAKVSTGLLIEPHLLERSKFKHTKPIAEELSHETVIAVDEYATQIGSFETKEAELDTSDDISLNMDTPFYDGVIDTESDLPLEGETPFYDGNIATDDDTILEGEHILYNMDVDAELGSAIIGEYYGIQFQQIGMDIDSIHTAGFGIVGTDGHVLRTRINKDGHHEQQRVQVYRVQESSVINVPENINYSDSSLGTHLVPQTVYKYRVTTIPFPEGSTPATPPSVGGSITEVIALDGYFPSHYRYTGDASTGMERSFSLGSKQTALTTLDSGPAWETFITNPNVLKVSDTGRGSGEPILEVD